MRAADKTKALIIGVSQYADATLTLGFASANARSLAGSLTLEQGCGIPKEHVRTLWDQDASRNAIMETLKEIADGCDAEDTLIFYFSGHGEKNGSTFYLLPVDTDVRDLDRSAIRAEELQAALGSCRANGILLILDCCKSAGFAEEAQKFFTTLPTQAYRILLSASRSGQLSFEFTNSQGTLFTKALVDVVSGKVAAGATPGVVYFSDLYEYVQMQIAEDLEILGHHADLQEPVFAGSFTKDPRLFILRELSLERVEAESPRYSRKFVQRRIRRVLIGVCCLTLFGLAAYYTYLDHTRYIWHEAGIVNGYEGDYLSIYPRYNWLGFPHRILTTDIRVEALPSAVRPGVGVPIRSRWSLDMQPLLFPQLSDEWKTAVSVWMGAYQRAWDHAKDIDVYDNPDITGQRQAAEAIASVAVKQDISKLEDFTSSDANDSTPPALRRIAQLDPGHAIDMLADEDDDLKEEKFERAVLQGLPVGCTKGVVTFLSVMAKHADDNSYIHDAWFGAFTRTGCSVPLATVMQLPALDKSVWDRNLDWLPYLSKHQSPIFGQRLANELKLAIHSPDSNLNDDQKFRRSLRLWTLLRTATVLYPDVVPEETTNLLSSSYKNVRFAAARALLAKNKANVKLLVTSYGDDPWIVTALVESGWLDENVIRRCIWPLAAQAKPGAGDYADTSVMYLMKVIRLRRIIAAKALTQEMASRFSAFEVKAEAARTVEALSGGPLDATVLHQLVFGNPSSIVTVDKLSQYAFLKGTYSWLIRSDPGLLKSFLMRMGEDPDEAAELIGRHPLSNAVLAQLRKQLDRDDLRLKSAAVLAMQGSESDLRLLLSSPDMNLRTEAMEYAMFNPNASKVFDLPVQFGTQTKFYLQHQLELIARFNDQSSTIPISTKGLALGVMMGEDPDVSWGLRLKLENQIEQLEGSSTDYGEEVALVNGPVR